MTGRQQSALIALVGGGIGAQAVLQLSSAFNVTINTGQAIYIAAVLSSIAVLLHRMAICVFQQGLRGCWRRLLDGAPPAPPKEET